MTQNVKTDVKTDVYTIDEVMAILDETRAQLAALAARVEQLEAGSKTRPQTETAVASVSKPVEQPAPVKQEITEEEVLAVSAALAAYLGVRVHIRQMRLLSSSAWAQQGRVSVHAHIPYTH